MYLLKSAKRPFTSRNFSTATIPSFDYKVKGQSGSVGQMMVGSSCFHGDEYINALVGAAGLGVRHFDSALLYGN